MSVALVLSACTAPVREVGLIGNISLKTVTAFEPGAGELNGSVEVPTQSESPHYVIAVNEQGTRAYISDRLRSGGSGTIHVVRLGDEPPTISDTFSVAHSASWIATVPGNPLLIVTAGREEDGQYVISTHAVNGVEIDRLIVGTATGAIAMEMCDDGETILLARGGQDSSVRKYQVAMDGELDQDGAEYDIESTSRVAGVCCAPGSQAAVVVMNHGGQADALQRGSIESFDIATMSGEDVRQTAGHFGLAGDFGADGDQFYVRSEGFVERFAFDPENATLGSTHEAAAAAPLVSASLSDRRLIATSGDGQYVFVTDTANDRVLVLNAGPLTTADTLEGDELGEPLSIVIGGGEPDKEESD